MGSVNEITNRNYSDDEVSEQKRWQSEFPYHWDADELTSRRDLLQFAVYASGTLFLGTALLALLQGFLPVRETTAKEIARIAEIPRDEAVYFHYPGPEDQAMLLRLESERLVAYSQTCTHLSCSVYYQKDQNRLFCPCHEGVFDTRTGEPVAGPPVRPLSRITLQANGDKLYAIRGGTMTTPLGTRTPSFREQPKRAVPPPGEAGLVGAALMIGILLLALQLWILTVALEEFSKAQR